MTSNRGFICACIINTDIFHFATLAFGVEIFELIHFQSKKSSISTSSSGGVVFGKLGTLVRAETGVVKNGDREMVEGGNRGGKGEGRKAQNS